MGNHQSNNHNMHNKKKLTGGSLPATSWMEVLNPSLCLGQVRHAVFDFDGTLSVIRSGWEKVMIPLMIEAICGGQAPDASIAAEVAEYVDCSTGILTIKQMEWLEAAVRRHGLAGHVLTARQYKKEYNERILTPVRQRMNQMDGSQASQDALMLAGSRAFLQGLNDRGVTLYLVSGTDHIYVMEEAAALGIVDFFDGRI
ncbi:MAG: HAD family hydrolase, partial [Omnitrophica WOR_2 bacterium]